MNRRAFLRAVALGSAGLGLLACSPAAPASPTAPAAKPATPAAPTTAVAAPAAATTTGETPRRGGELVYVVSAEPPSFDGHKESTFAVIHPVSPHYSTLLKFDPDNYPKVVGDLAESWTVSPEGLTYTFKVRDGVKFHDGSLMTSRDVRVSYERIIKPAEGIISARKQSYGAIDAIDTPDPRTVVFRAQVRRTRHAVAVCFPVELHLQRRCA